MQTLPHKLPGRHLAAAGVTSISDQDVGGYDFMVGGYGFRLATDQQFAYQRGTEPTTTHRFDSSLEPGEQSLSPLPWIKSQSSFHGGAGQLNLEQGFTAFQYQAEQVEHIRFDNCLGVNVWTPGQVTRLPDSRFYNFGFTSSCMVAGTAGNVDYAIIGGNGGLYQAAWVNGPNADPIVTQINLAGATYVSNANCNITSLATDGVHYFGVLQMTSLGSQPGILTYIIRGSITSTSAPDPVYQVPGTGTASPRTNMVTNPNFEGNVTTGYTTRGTPGGPALSTQTGTVHSGTYACAATFAGADVSHDGPMLTLTTVNGVTYTASAYAYVPASNGSGSVLAFVIGGANGTSTSGTGTWQRISVTFTATGTSTQVCFGATAAGAGNVFYLDDVLVEVGASVLGYFDGSTATDASYTYAWTGTPNASTSKANPIAVGGNGLGIVGWAKQRLIGCLSGKLYELDGTAAVQSALPTPRYTHPVTNWLWTAIAESPDGILAAGYVGGQAAILEFTLDTSGGTPFLSGGENVGTLPIGEIVYSLSSVTGSFLAIGTSSGIRVGTYDTYTGRLKLNALSVNTTQPVLATCTRDRFIYGSYTNQQADGKTGLVAVDVSMVTDVAGRNAWAPDLRPPTTAPTGLGAVTGVAVLPYNKRLLYVTPEGLHVEGNGPGTDGTAWIRTSRVRWDTAELKLFKLGRIHGSLDVASITVTGIAPYGVSQNLGTFGFISGTDPGEFRLISSTTYEWMQLQFTLNGSACVFNSYQMKAYPAPQRQHIIELTANCFVNEVDRFGLEVTDPVLPRQRLLNVQNLEAAGGETRLVEFTNFGPVAQLVVIDQIIFRSFSRPNYEDDFGGYITFRLRATEN